MNQIVLNKSKQKTIIFIHGFYANAGYWLPYLASFKEYRIVLLNIDYTHLLRSKNIVDATKMLFDNIDYGKKICAIISHSLGTVVSNFINIDMENNRFEICPVAFSDRYDSVGFVRDIKLKINQDEGIINENLLLVDKLISESRDYISYNNILYLPSSDQYFNYSVKGNIKINFRGNHFDIKEAIFDIADRIKQ